MRLRVPAIALLVVAAMFAHPYHAAAQTPDRDAVLATVQKVFDAMRTRDTALFTQAFDTSARLVGVSNRGTPAITLTTPAQFAAAILRSPAANVRHERIYDPEVRIDLPVAQVWAYYTFHLNETFNHCGIDAFMLVKVGGVWKITQIADSRRTEGCTHTEPPK
ncbi:MAG TPA: nuclear transport factor 2 family protein [Gemmatimonadaceae bacterium]|nr:nuclear transport factor 2 family protein [Gemmatimonadaceae bacterium]